MDYKKAGRISRIVVLGCVAIIFIWDIAAILLTGAQLEASISQAVWDFSRKAPFVPFIAGFICGHLFWGDPATSIVWTIKGKKNV